ncbi:MAG: DNA polymerase, partial [Eubacteriales bacterium]|nr:DNA polymerase [Eubacteriales bacterium]
AISLMRNLKLAAGINSTVEECKSFIANLAKSYRTLAKLQKDTISLARLKTYAETAFGRRRYLPEIRSIDYMKRGNAERSALNHGVQGLAADILKLSMARLVIMLPGYLKPIFTVHDSLVFECPDDRIDDAILIIKGAMEASLPITGFDMDIVAEASVGKSYGSMEER